MIERYSSNFFDFARGEGVVDAYNWFRNNQQELSGDGIHVNSQGADSWNRLWAHDAGARIYIDLIPPNLIGSCGHECVECSGDL